MMIVGIATETHPGEQRVASVPDLVGKLKQIGCDVVVQRGAGVAAGYPDSDFQAKGARLADEVLSEADVVFRVQPLTNEEIAKIKEGGVVIGFLQPYSNIEGIKSLAWRRITSFAMEFMPRITRAQPMDALSAMSTISGYKAVLLGASRLPKMFPLMMTAAGTLTPARVFIIGAGVAGLQAIGTAKRLGAVVEAYDTRPAVKEQVESLGGKFVDLGLETKDSEAKGGYAAAQSEEFYKKQQQAMSNAVMNADVVIPTALVPGKRAPILVTEEMVRRMKPGSIIVDVAADQGGNCELSEPGKDVVKHGVTIIAPLNIPSTVPYHASQMYARTVVNYLTHLVKDGAIQINLEDELTKGPLITRNGEIVHDAVRSAVS